MDLNYYLSTYYIMNYKLLYNKVDNTIPSKYESKNNAEYTTPYKLRSEMLDSIPEEFWQTPKKVLEPCCGKGGFVISIIEKFNKYLDMKTILEECVYFSDINKDNVDFVINLLNFEYKLNYKVCDVLKLDWSGFDAVITNPPFEDRNKCGKTQHKLWVKITKRIFSNYLKDGGLLLQITPFSFGSPSNKLFKLFKEKQVKYINFGKQYYFKNVNVNMAWYLIYNNNNDNDTLIDNKYEINLKKCLYLPNDIKSIDIHKKVMFNDKQKYNVLHDFNTLHNIRRYDENPVLSEVKTDKHIHPVFHTNRKVWYSSITNKHTKNKKVIWSKSGYTKPIYDKGIYSMTDFGFYILVNTDEEGENIVHNLNSKLFRYIFKTAKWCGFGDHNVFANIPVLPNRKMTDKELCEYFDIKFSIE